MKHGSWDAPQLEAMTDADPDLALVTGDLDAYIKAQLIRLAIAILGLSLPATA